MRRKRLPGMHASHSGVAVEYLRRLPASVPLGQVLVHNHIRPTRRLGMRGFRAWLRAPDPVRLVECDCAWAPELGRHFRVRRPGLDPRDRIDAPDRMDAPA